MVKGAASRIEDLPLLISLTADFTQILELGLIETRISAGKEALIFVVPFETYLRAWSILFVLQFDGQFSYCLIDIGNLHANVF